MQGSLPSRAARSTRLPRPTSHSSYTLILCPCPLSAVQSNLTPQQSTTLFICGLVSDRGGFSSLGKHPRPNDSPLALAEKTTRAGEEEPACLEPDLFRQRVSLRPSRGRYPGTRSQPGGTFRGTDRHWDPHSGEEAGRMWVSQGCLPLQLFGEARPKGRRRNVSATGRRVVLALPA